MILNLRVHLDQHLRASHARPGTQAEKCGVDISPADETFHGGINPAIKRDIDASEGRRKRRRGLLGHDLQIVIDLWIMSRLVNMPSDLITEQAADENVGKEMLVRGRPRRADSERQAVGGKFRNQMRIFLRHHGRERPCKRSMIGGKRCAAVQEDILEIRRKRPFPSGDSRQRIIDSNSIDHGFRRQDAGLAKAVVVRDPSPDVSRAGQSACGRQTGIGREIQPVLRIEPHGIGALRIGDEQRRGNASRRDQPFGIAGIEVKRTGPDVLLVFRQMDEEIALVGMGNRSGGSRL